MPSIEFQKETLGQILKTRAGLKVPRNQRAYAWEEDHVTDLFYDLNKAIQENVAEYFLGTVVVVNQPDHSTCEVYDGQQRLATTAMLISAMRDFVADKLGNLDEANTIRSQFLVARERMGEVKPKLTLSATDHMFFEEYVLLDAHDPRRIAAKPDPRKASHRLIKAAAEMAKDHVNAITQQLDSQAQLKLIDRWCKFLENGARVIWVEVADHPTAYHIFETMNDRGLKLSSADLLKNYLYSSAKTSEETVVQQWLGMVGSLETLGSDDGVVDYIRCFWVSENGHTRSSELFDAIRKKKTTPLQIVAFSKSLNEKANDYAALLTPTHERWATRHLEVKRDIDTLRYLGVTQIRPLLLAALAALSENQFDRLLKNAVSWSVRCLMGGVSSGNLEGAYAKAAKRLTAKSVTTVEQIAADLKAIIPADDKFLAGVETASVPTASLARYYLREMQVQRDGKAEPEYTPNDLKAITLEHVYPKSAAGWTHITPDDGKAILNRLGNLCLLPGTPNSGLGNVLFSVKKPTLKKSKYSLTKMVGKEKVWGLPEITKRQQELAKLAVKRWPFLQ